MKKILAALSVALAFNASASGYLESATKYTYAGWACRQSTPGYQGWIHFWRDDNVFLGALPANIPREAAVGAVCGDSGAHGFGGTLSFSATYLDNRSHSVHAYFINQDNTVFELSSSPRTVLFDGAPPAPPPVQPTTETGCGLVKNNSQWALTSMSPWLCNIATHDREWTYTYLSNLPIGYTLDSCTPPPFGWQTLSARVEPISIQGKCNSSDGWGGYKNDTTWTIKRIN